MSFDRINRRTHLYLGLFLLTWLLMYGVSAVPFTRHEWFDARYDDGVPEWTERFSREYAIDAAPGSDPRAAALRILEDSGMGGQRFWAGWQGEGELVIYAGAFWSGCELRYRPEEHRLVAREPRFRWDHVLTGLHATGGFEQERFPSDLLAVVVDFVMIAILLWAATGLYMWWGLRQSRRLGALALASGIALVLGLLLVL